MKRENVLVSEDALARQREFEAKIKEMFTAREAHPVACVDTFGCQQNVADGQKLMGMLAASGFTFTEDPKEADLVILNTCAVREHAEQRVFGNLGILTHSKKENPEQVICLCGCMAQEERVSQRVKESYHLEIVGATIQMLLAGVNGNLKDAAERNDVFGEGISKDDFIHSAFSVNPQFGVLTGGGPRLTDSNGVPWQGSYVNANSDLTVDLRSDIAAESRAKIVYEYLMQFTDDKDVLATLNFLMTREVAHFQQFEAALDTIQPNFPPGVLQSDPRYSNIYSNHSMGEDARGPWNEGESTGLGEEWLYVENPRQQVLETDGLTDLEPQGTPRTEASVRSADKKLSKQRSSEIRKATPEKNLQWSQYGSQDAKAPRRQPVGQE